MCMFNPIRSIVRKLWLACSVMLFVEANAMTTHVSPDNQAVQWRDTLYVRIVDSVFIEADKTLEFSLEIYRPNDDWNKDKVLGDFDFYFSYSSKAFQATATPSFDYLMDKLDQSTSGRQNLLFGYTHFYAGRYGICGRADNSGGTKYEIPLQTWVKLCRVKVPMSQADQNPGIRWDVKATGAMTAGGNPIILKLAGDVISNPKATVKAAGLHVMPELQCQGEDVYVYVRDAITSGHDLKYTWRDSVAGETWNVLGEFGEASTVKTGSSKNGRYHFEILGKGDTLVIKNSPGVVDGMFFNCTLTDASVGASMKVDTVVDLRDSLYAWLASTDPTVTYGMSGNIDTVKKCPDLPANLQVYVFGPTLKEMKSSTEFGNTITLFYCYLDKDLNTKRDSVKIPRTTLTSGYIQSAKPDNKLKKDLFRYSWTTEHTGKIWVESLRTEYCDNGAGYPPYDTLVIQEVEGDLSYNLDPLTVSVNDCADLDTVTTTVKPYEIFLKTSPSPINGMVMGDNTAGNVYQYCADAEAGFDTVYYEYSKGGCKMKAYRSIEVVENSYLTMKVLLEGPYLGVNAEGKDTMDCSYATKELYGEQVFPRNNTGKLNSPYDDGCVLDISIRKISDIEVPSTIVDWIYVRLREVVQKNGVDAPGNHYIDSLSAFILTDGSICAMDGKPVKFKNIAGVKVYVEVVHRNHLKILSSKPKVLRTEFTEGVFDFDFTNRTQVWEGEQVLSLKLGKYCLVAGDIDRDDFLGVSDKVLLTKNNGLSQYLYDIDGDGFIGVLDKKYITLNNGKYARP